MAYLGQTYDLSSVETAPVMEAVPPGTYTVAVRSSEMKDTKNRNGQYLLLELEVQEGEYAKRIIFDRLNLINPNTTAVEIAYRTLASVCDALGLPRKISDSSSLHFRPMRAVVDVEARDGYAPSNVVKKYLPLADSPQPAEATPAAAAAPAKPSWAR